jgi:prolipoprotein diacylglyceryltransferase
LPWGLEIPRWARPAGFADYTTFHPTFLYESLWCALIGLLLLKYGSRLAPGATFPLYVTSYCLGRLVFELIRIDEAHHIFGIRLNVFVSVAVGLASLALFRRFSRASR